MSYATRTKDNPGDVGRAADQQQSIDNEAALYAALLGAGPVATGGMVLQYVKKLGMADNVATEFATISTTNEAGNADGGVWMVTCEMMAAHGSAAGGETSASFVYFRAARAINSTGAAGTITLVTSGTDCIAASTAGTKTITSVTITVAETSEYVISLRAQIDCAGGAVTTGEIYGMIRLHYAGFTTPPVITSAG